MIFVVVPAYNEEKNIGRVVRGLFEHGYNNVVVVDDGSEDNTCAEAEKTGAIILRHMINRGQGAALQTGNDYCLKNNAEIIVHFDADGQFNPIDIKTSLEILTNKNVDAVFGSRFLDNRSKIPWFKRFVVLPVSRIINKILTGVELSDAHNGFRAAKSSVFQKITIFQDRMAHNSEIVAEIKRAGISFAECPVEVKYHDYGQSAFSGFKILLDIFLKKLSN
jgi:glycosyltransferase involved in cell wall biosynthesis